MKKTFTVAHKRKRQGKTNYKYRLRLLQSRKPRLIIRKSLAHMSLQIATYQEKGDKIEITVHSKELQKRGWKSSTGNLPAAYLSGLLLGKKAIATGIKDAILDIGMQKAAKGGRIFAAVKGCKDAGLTIPAQSDVFPSEERISGKHIPSINDASAMVEETKKTILSEQQ